jgi:GT2 family glycosyltransferase
VGAAMLIPKQTIEEIGLFDERFFCWYNDIDYSLSITARGKKCYTTSLSTIYHFGGKSSDNVSVLKQKDKTAFLQKWQQMRSFLNQYYGQIDNTAAF